MLTSWLFVLLPPAGEAKVRAEHQKREAEVMTGLALKDVETAEYLKESSMSHFGVPRGLLEEARAMKKLTTKAVSTSDKA